MVGNRYGPGKRVETGDRKLDGIVACVAGLAVVAEGCAQRPPVVPLGKGDGRLDQPPEISLGNGDSVARTHPLPHGRGTEEGDGGSRQPPVVPLGKGDGGAVTVGAGPEVVSLVYYSWGRYSPGAGFSRSDGRAIEVDFVRHRVRSIIDSAKAPEPMRPPMNLLLQQLWADLSPQREAKIRRAVAAWFATGPPRECLLMRAWGSKESSYTERLVVTIAARGQRVPARRDSPSRVRFDPRVRFAV